MRIIVIEDSSARIKSPLVKIPKDYQQMCRRIVKSTRTNLSIEPSRQTKRLELEKIFSKAAINIVLSSNSQIRELNRKWRHKNKATDVLSFPIMLEEPLPKSPWIFGEIYISLEKTKEQAEKYEHSFKRELAFLTVHGLLHLLGFDHQKAADEKDMFSRQKAILESAGYCR